MLIIKRDPEANKNRALNAGAAAFFQKPTDNDELLACIAGKLCETE